MPVPKILELIDYSMQFFCAGVDSGRISENHLARAFGNPNEWGCLGEERDGIVAIHALELEKAAGKQGQLAHRLMHADLVVLDLCAAVRYVRLPGQHLG